MGIHPTCEDALLYHGRHCRSFGCQPVKGWHALPGRRMLNESTWGQQDDRSHRPTGGANPESSADEPIERQHTNCVMNCRVRSKTQVAETIAIRLF
jgi:hypothetical protein